MKRINLIILVILGSASFLHAQEIITERSFVGVNFYQGEEQKTFKEVLEMSESVPQAYTALKKSKQNLLVAQILAGTGLGFLAFTAVNSADGGEFLWETAAIGGGLLLVALPFNAAKRNRVKEGVRLLNEAIMDGSYEPRVELIGNGNGIGVGLRF
ncbi:hypothetical protein GCM10009117_10490 [Gangjinia marincola]|uniref:Uncharacterized protein n=1 Tax=Gangjinia marincola TaxID=578463 RepID=A0ABP3XRB3_9FLAO